MAPRTRFPGGLVLEAHKARAASRPIALAPAPAVAMIALGTGAAGAAPCVAVGQRVRLGERIAVALGPAAVEAHAPVSGRVVAIDECLVAGGSGRAPGIAIENDGSDTRDERCVPLADFESCEPSRVVEFVRAGGIAGLGGAAFPTARKLETAGARAVRRLLLNGVECEPWICCDDLLMRERAGDVLLGARILLHASGAGRCTIAVEDDKPEAQAALRAALAAAGDERFDVAVLPAVYPSGGERQLVLALTGEEVPSGGLPADVGVLVQNVATAAAVARLVTTGEPLLRRLVTVTGSAVASPGNLEARIGTPVRELIAACGGYCAEPARLVHGGGMTGIAFHDDGLPLGKSTNCVIVAGDADLAPAAAELPCIRCGDCARVCPATLLPQQLHWAARAADFAALERLGLADCIECGCCDYVCPSRIALTPRFHAAREELDRRRATSERAARAQQRFERHAERLAREAEARQRAFAEARRMTRGELER